MSSKSPIFPIMPQSQHFSDYGFDPQIDYFQVLEEARKHKRESTRPVDSVHFKLTKPISKDDRFAKKKRWWRNAFRFFNCKWARNRRTNNVNAFSEDVHQARARAFRVSISGPVYITESRTGSAAPRRSSGRCSSRSNAGAFSPVGADDVAGIPYVSLRQLHVEQQQRVSTSALPIYLVT